VSPRGRAITATAVFLALMGTAWLMVVGRSAAALNVYCAHDAVFSERLITWFSDQTGVLTEVKYDSEVAKSLGLVQQLEREAVHPLCDVFWNNEPLGTMSLAAKGLLEPYESPEAAKRPSMFRDPENRWTEFGLRYRVWIVNTGKMPATMEAIDQRMNGGDLSRVAVAEPLYGTTLTHWSLLWNRMGGEELKKWHRSLKDRGVHFVKGNGAVRDLVAAGTCDLGMTDTDDFFGALDAKNPVAMQPIRVQGKTIAIPNTVSIMKGARHPEAARQFVDYLLSAKSEVALAKSGSRQAPVHADAAGMDVPAEIAEMHAWAAEAADLSGLTKSRDECLEWLQKEFAP
jgi:iron(III) transport system substrate-binding protein